MAPLPTIPILMDGLAQSTSPSFKITKSDYETEVDEIFGDEALAYLVLTDSDRSVHDARGVVSVNVTSDKDPDGFEIDLLETGIGTGVFVGGFGFAPEGDSSSQDFVKAPGDDSIFGRSGLDGGDPAVIGVDSGSKVTVKTVGSQQRTADVVWKESHDAEFIITHKGSHIKEDNETFEGNFGNINPTVTFQVKDETLNQASGTTESYEGLLRVWSRSDRTGESITIQETGTDTGVFQATIRFEDSPADNERVFVQNGDWVRVEFTENHNADGNTIHHRFPTGDHQWTFKRIFQESILLDREEYFGTTQSDPLHGADRAVIFVGDAGEADSGSVGPGTLTVNVCLDEDDCESSPDVTVSATQTSGGSPSFIGHLGFGAGCPLDECLNVPDGGEFFVSYEGQVDSARWHAIDTADHVIILNPNVDTPLFGTDQTYTVQVVDDDANRDRGQKETVDVRVKSTGDPPSTFDLSLEETGADTGRFEGDFRFTTDPAEDDAMIVSDGSLVRVEYVDAHDADGRQSSVWSRSPLYWREAVQAEIKTDFDVYYKQLDDDDNIVNQVEILVVDPTRSNPNQRNEAQVTARYLDASEQTTIPLKEVGTDTGIFHGTMGFGSGVGELPVDGTETEFEFRYEQLDGTIVTSDTITLSDQPDDTILRLEQDYGIADWLRAIDSLPVDDECQEIAVTLYGFTGTNPVVTVTSAVDENTHELTLLEEGPSTRHSNTFTAGDDSSCDLEVTDEDTITADYGELSASADTRPLDDESVVFRNTGGQQINEVSGENTPTVLRVQESRFGRNSAFTEVYEVGLSAEADLQVPVVETSTGSETFTGGFLYTTEEGSIEEAGRIAVASGLDIMADPDSPDEFAVYTTVTASVGEATASLHWYPADDADLSVTRAWGLGTTAPFKVTLTDGDGLSHRMNETTTSSDDQRTYNFDDGPYIHGSELVFFEDADGGFAALNPLDGTCNDADSTSADDYERRTNGIRLCADPADGRDMIFTYVQSRRTVRVLGDTGDEIAAVIPFHSMSGARAVFKGDVRPSLASDDNSRIQVTGDRSDIQFLYSDPVKVFNGGPGSDEPGHPSTIGFEQEWRRAEDAQVRIMRPDFSGAASGKIYGPVSVEVRDVDSSQPDRFDSIEVELKGAADGTASLFETGMNTGVFRGVITAGPGSGDDAYAEYKDPRSSSGAVNIPRESTAIEWEAASDAEIKICDTEDPEKCSPGDNEVVDGTQGIEFRGTNKRFIVRIEDSDRNTDPTTVQMIKAHIVSASDPVGKEITLTQTGADSDIFESEQIRFSTTPTTVKDRLFVEQNDDHVQFWVEYEDPMFATDNGKNVVSRDQGIRGLWKSVADGKVSFDREIHIGTDTGALDDPIQDWVALEKMAFGTVVIDDPDLNDEPAKIEKLMLDGSGNLKKDANPIGTLSFGPDAVFNSLELWETGFNTGVFIGFFTFDGSGPHFDFGQKDFETFSTTYQANAEISLADPHESTAQAEWFTDEFGVVTFDRSGYNKVDDRPRVTVYDSNLNTTSLGVNVVSEADTSGISLSLSPRDDVPENPTDTNKRGVYTGDLRLSTSSSSGSTIHVGDEDTIEVRYTDTSPLFPGERTDRAVIGIGDVLPPETTLVTNPSAPNGENDWFTTAPTVSFETDKSSSRIAETVYRINGGGENSISPDGSFALSEGIHEITFWSVDVFDNVEAEQTVQIKVSLTVPEGAVEDLAAEARPGGDVGLSWTGVEIEGLAPLTYHIYRGPEDADFEDDDVVRVGNSTEESHTDLPETDAPPQRGESFQYFVVVANEAGQASTDVVGVEGLSDRVAPRIDSFVVDVDELQEAESEDTANAELTLVNEAVNLADVHNVTLRVIDPFGNAVDESEMAEGGSSSVFQAAYDAFDTCGVYSLVGVARDPVGNEGTNSSSVRYVAIDNSPPQLRDMATQIQQGESLNVTVVDNCAGVGSIEYTIDGGERRTANVPDRSSDDDCNIGPCTVNFQISASRFNIGENEVTFYLADANATTNEAVETIIVRMVELDDDDDDDDELTAPTIETDGFTALVENGGEFVFRVSGGGLSLLTFDGENVLGGLGSGGQVRVDISDYAAGEHTVPVRVENLLGDDRHDFTFYVLDEGIPLPPVNVQVTKDDLGRPVISWQDNPDRRAEIGGYVIHRAASPWRVIGIVDGDTTSYTDLTATGKTSYQYAVTAYGTGGQGLLAEGDDSAESLPWFQGVQASTFETDDIESGIPPIVWWVALVVVAVLLVVGLIYANRRQIFGRREEELYTEDYPDEAETPFGEERHLISCPNCSTEFHVTGERPVVTNCPNCGRKGILR